MGSELVSDEPTPLGGGSDTAFSYTEIFYQHLPYYLSIGMTYDEFWYEDCVKVKYYRQAEKMRENRKNQELWLSGLYTYNALCSALCMFGEDGIQPYIDEPIPLTLEGLREKKERDERKEYEENMAKMEAFMKGVNQSLSERSKS